MTPITLVSQDQITDEVNDYLDDLVGRSEILRPGDIVPALLNRHRGALKADHPDVGHWEAYGWGFLRDLVRRCINDRGKGPRASTKTQLELPGFDRGRFLQDYYAVERDGDTVHVPLLQMTIAELAAKEQEYRTQAEGLVEHANELRAFREWRAEELRKIQGAEEGDGLF